ncbi:MAG: hypothetical protein MJ094_04110 [Saccharofermentans sp.]|nr:hypothetical protein [Saccharofermentans sp.]
MVLKYRSLLIAASIYLLLPVVIFFLGFTKLYWAIILSALTFVSAFFVIRTIDDKRTITISKKYIIGIALFCLAWCYIAGIGEFTWTTADHNVRYAILNDVVNYKWPIIYDLSTQSNPLVLEQLGSGSVAFAYYLIFWLVPGLVGKLFGLMAARVALILWSSLGLVLTVLALNFMQKKPMVTAFVLLFVFGGFDIVMYIITSAINGGSSFEGWNREFYIHGNYYQTMNTFNQTIPCWLIMSLFLNSRNNRSVGFWGALCFCYSPWATVGMVPLAICKLYEDKSGRNFKSILTIGNIVMPIVTLAVFGLYYTANSGATDVKGFIWNFFPNQVGSMIGCYLLYVLVEFGLWSLLIFKDQKNNPMFWVALIVLLVMPIYKITKANDFLMRGSLAPIFVITTYVLQKVDTAVSALKKNGNDTKAVGVIGMLIVSACTCFILLAVSISATVQLYRGDGDSIQPKDEIVSFGDIADENQADLCRRQFFVYEYESKPFYRVFGK